MAKTIISVFSLFCCLVGGSLLAADTTPDKPTGFAYRHQAGVRIGAWSNLGDLPPKSDSGESFKYEANIKDASFYTEVYFAYRFRPSLMGEIGLGISNRGDVTVEDYSAGYTDSYYGNLSVYVVSFRAKIYPLAQTKGKLFPYLSAGGAFYHGRHSIEISNDPYVISGKSRTAVSYILGAGIDMPVASQIGVELAMSYEPAKFSKELFEVKDYQALTITVGVKYLFLSTHK